MLSIPLILLSIQLHLAFSLLSVSSLLIPPITTRCHEYSLLTIFAISLSYFLLFVYSTLSYQFSGLAPVWFHVTTNHDTSVVSVAPRIGAIAVIRTNHTLSSRKGYLDIWLLGVQEGTKYKGLWKIELTGGKCRRKKQ